MVTGTGLGIATGAAAPDELGMISTTTWETAALCLGGAARRPAGLQPRRRRRPACQRGSEHNSLVRDVGGARRGAVRAVRAVRQAAVSGAHGAGAGVRRGSRRAVRGAVVWSGRARGRRGQRVVVGAVGARLAARRRRAPSVDVPHPAPACRAPRDARRLRDAPPPPPRLRCRPSHALCLTHAPLTL